MAVGRPKKTIDFALATRLVKLGLTEEELSEVLDISVETLRLRKDENADFAEALRNWEQYADERVEKSLYMRAIGIEYDEVRTVEKGDTVETHTMRRRELPQTLACMFWLKNRRPDKWRDKPQEGNDEDAVRKTMEEYTTTTHGNM